LGVGLTGAARGRVTGAGSGKRGWILGAGFTGTFGFTFGSLGAAGILGTAAGCLADRVVPGC
jgi:hypothetical protein